VRVYNASALDGPSEMNVMMQTCGSGLMVAGFLAAGLRLGLLGSLIVLVWVVIGRLRREAVSTIPGIATPR